MEPGMGYKVPWSDDPKKHSAAFKLFHYNFYAFVSGLHLVSAEELRVFGYVTTGNSAWDRQLMMEDREIYVPVSTMVRIHAEGGTVRLRNPEDGGKIYEYIYQHLQDWRHEIELNPTRLKAPMEDLRAFDDFARDLHQYARYHLRFNPANNSLFAALERLAHGRGTARPGKDGVVTSDQDYQKLSHKSSVDTMTKLLRDRERSFSN